MKVVLSGGLFVLEAIASGAVAGSETGPLSPAILLTSVLGAVPVAWQLAAAFYGDSTAEIAAQPGDSQGAG